MLFRSEFNTNQDYSEGLSISFRLNHTTPVDNISPYVFGPLGPGASNGERGVQAQTYGDKFYVQAGAGIVADSKPLKEYEETVNKAKALINALK